MEIADGHVHIGDLNNAIPYFGANSAGHGTTPWDMEEDLVSRVRAMDAVGVAWAMVQPSHGYLRPDGIKDTMRVNDTVAAFRNRDPQRFPAACGTVEPLHGERSLAELDRIKHELRLDGVSWHHRFSGCTIDSKWMWPILERMRELKLTPVVHTNAESHFEAAWQLQRIARDFPDMEFLAQDAFYAYERGNHILGSAKLSPNIVWDIGGMVSYVTADQWVVLNGSRTISFSGVASYPLAPGATPSRPKLLLDLEKSAMPAADKQNVLSKNLRRLFRMPPEGAPRPLA